MLRLLPIVAAVLISGCASLPAGYDRAESRAFSPQATASTPLVLAAREAQKGH